MAATDQVRDDEGPLHVMVETAQCALSGCVPCCAKVLINQGASTSLPNARPETCFRLVRAANSTKKPRVTSIGLYRQGQSILTVGDGDFSFSLALARALKGARVVATSYESHASLAKVYGTACIDTLRELEQLGAVVAHGVDAAELGTTLPAGAVPTGGFDRVVWNFPCASALPLHRPCSTPAPPLHRPCTAPAPPLRRLCAASAPPAAPLHRRIASSAALPLCRCVARSADGAVMSGAGAGADARGSVDIEANRRLVARFCTGGAALLAAQGELHITHKVVPDRVALARRALERRWAVWRKRCGGQTLSPTATLGRWGCSSGTSSSRGCRRRRSPPPARRQLARARQACSSTLAQWRSTGRRILRIGRARCAARRGRPRATLRPPP